MTRCLLAILLLTVSGQLAAQDNRVYPPGARIIDVTQPPFSADPTGTHDATQAIQAAIDSASKIVYFPNGTYLVSNTIRWSLPKYTRDYLQGQNRDGVVIKLQNECPGYDNPNVPKAIFYTGEAPAQRFQNYIKNMTISTGSGNPGAVGIQFMANNLGAIYDTKIVSGDGQGVVGLDLGYSNEQGPCLIKRVEVEGFDTGIRTKYDVNSITMEYIILKNQNVVGLLNDGQVVSIRKLISENTVTAIHTKGNGLITLVEAELRGSGAAQGVPAILNENGLLARSVATSGYQLAIKNTGGHHQNAVGDTVKEFVSHDIVQLFDSPLQSLNLPIQETPSVPWEANFDEWANVEAYGPPEDTIVINCRGEPLTFKNWRTPFQRAIDSGKKNIYMPFSKDTYFMAGTIYVRNNVQRLHGMMREVKARGCVGFSDEDQFRTTWIVQSTTAPTVIFEHFDAAYADFKIVDQSSGNLLVKDIPVANLQVDNPAGALFIENITCHSLRTVPGTKVWARQLNTEQKYEPRTLNDASDVWILGLKTENDSTVLTTINNGRTEILGAFNYANKAFNPNKVLYRNIESSMSVSMGEFVLRNQPFNPIYEVRNGKDSTLTASNSPYRRGSGSLIPLYVGYDGSFGPAELSKPSKKAVGDSLSIGRVGGPRIDTSSN